MQVIATGMVPFKEHIKFYMEVTKCRDTLIYRWSFESKIENSYDTKIYLDQFISTAKTWKCNRNKSFTI